MSRVSLIAVSLIIIAAAGFFIIKDDSSGEKNLIQNKSANQVDSDQITAVEEDRPGMVGETALRELLTGTAAIACTYSTDKDGLVYEGELYYDSPRFSARATTTDEEGAQAVSTILYDGTQAFVWTESDRFNFAISFSTQKDSLLMDDDATSSLNDAVAYSCRPWTVDDAQFVPPSSISFTSLGQR